MTEKQNQPEWRDVVGYEGLYKVSSGGEVFSIKNNLLLRPGTHTNGYTFVCLYKKGMKVKTKRVHRLVADAFIQKIDGKKYVNHKNGIVADNSASNLEWVSHSENIRHSYEQLGRRTNPNHGKDNHNSRQVSSFRDEKKQDLANTFESINAAAEVVGVFRTAISQAIRKGYKSGGFWWSYS